MPAFRFFDPWVVLGNREGPTAAANPVRPSPESPPSTLAALAPLAAPACDPLNLATAERSATLPIDPQWWRDEFEERAAIRTEGGLHTRNVAEQLAWGELLYRWHLAHGFRMSPEICAGCGNPIGGAEALDQMDGSRVHISDAMTA
jgi:hypothetical protein